MTDKFLLWIDLVLTQFGLTRLTAALAVVAGIALLIAAYVTCKAAWSSRFAGRPGLAGSEFMVVGAIALAFMASLVYPLSKAADNEMSTVGYVAGNWPHLMKWMGIGFVGVMLIVFVFVAMVVKTWPKPITDPAQFAVRRSSLRDARRVPTHDGLAFDRADDFV